MPKRKRRNARNDKKKYKIRKRVEVYDAQIEAKNEERMRKEKFAVQPIIIPQRGSALH